MIRVFPNRNKWIPKDKLAFVGYPDLFHPKDSSIPVKISVAFTWDIPRAYELLESWGRYFDDVQIGGPAFGDPGGEFTPGLFIKKGVTITSRGCPKKCKWCFASKREGSIRELKVKNGWIVQDNNLLACSEQHIRSVFEMLKRQSKAAVFGGGLDAMLLKDWHRDLFDSITFKELWFACDTTGSIKNIKRASKILDGIPQYKKRCYVMIGFNGETITNAERRLERVYELGYFPFCQLYQGANKKQYSDEWKKLARKWARPAAYNKKVA